MVEKMAAVTNKKFDRANRQSVDKFAERRNELAEAALQTLSELGYARTSLREIAQNSVFSHGVLHYYFNDKTDLILCCVRQYKAHCVTRYDQVVAESHTYEELVTGFLKVLGETVRNEGHCTVSGTIFARNLCSKMRSGPTSWRSTKALKI